MSGSNQYLAFAAQPGAYVLTPTAYAALGALATGAASGILPKETLNTPLRQSSIGVAALAQLVADSGIDMLDDGSVTNFKTKLVTALRAAIGPECMRSLVHPSIAGEGWRDLVRGGWRPAMFNQQWGGGPMPYWLVDAATDQEYRFEATGYVDDNASYSMGSAAGVYYKAQGFKVSQSQSVQGVWLKLSKTGSANRSVTAYIYTDNGSGSPSALVTNGTATAINLLNITSDSNGQWYRFVFATPPALTAGTQYHIVLSQAATDASNYVVWKANSAKKYPHGNLNDGTNVPAWTAYAAIAQLFLIEPTASGQMLQSGGIFDSKLVFADGNPLDQMACVINDASRVWNGKEATFHFAGSGWPASREFFGVTYGYFHDRILLRTDASGHVCVDAYTKAGVEISITGTSDVRTGDKVVGVAIRSVGDGADYITLYVNGAQEATISAQTIAFDPLMVDLGTAWLGGGFGDRVTMTQTLGFPFASLPSANGWTWTGTGTEANCMSVQSGKLVQNKNGYAATDTGYYAKATAGFSNANGWGLTSKLRIPSNTNAPVQQGVFLQVDDGTKVLRLRLHEYYLEATYNGSQSYVQTDFKQRAGVSFTSGKGSDAFVFVNGRLAHDYTGLLNEASAVNDVLFGDGSTTSGENADAVYSYISYYNTAAILPQAANGWALSEFAAFTDNQLALAPVFYNGGTFLSAKNLAGIQAGYVGEVRVQREIRRPITSGPTTTSSSAVVAPEMESFQLGSDLGVNNQMLITNNTAGAITIFRPYIDGQVAPGGAADSYITAPAINYYTPAMGRDARAMNFGLHKVETRWSTTAGTATSASRNLEVETRT